MACGELKAIRAGRKPALFFLRVNERKTDDVRGRDRWSANGRAGWPSLPALFARILCCVAFFAGEATARAAGSIAEPRLLLLDAAIANDAIVAVGERGTILRSTDQAATFTPATSPARATLTGVSFSGNSGWAVGHDALILATSDGGKTWKQQYQAENLQDSFLDVLALDARRVIAVGAYGLCVMTADGGASWTPRKPLDDDCHLNRLSRGPTGTLYLAGERGTLLRSTDDGVTWTPIRAPYEGSFYGVLPLAEKTLLAHGLRGHVYRSTDDGATWATIATPSPVLLATAAQLAPGTIALAGHSRTLFVSRDGGKTFEAATTPPSSAIARLIALPDGRLIGLGEAGRTIITLSP